MSKLTIILGKRVQEVVERQGTNLTSTPFTLFYPELYTVGTSCYPLHASVFIPPTLHQVVKYLEQGRDVAIVTQSDQLVSHIAEAVEQGRIGENEVHLYEDDNSSFRMFTITEKGVMSEGWPFGWFLH